MRMLTSRDLFNAQNAGLKPDMFIDRIITVIAIGEYEDEVTDLESGEVSTKPVSVIVTVDDEIITSPSPTLNKAVKGLIKVAEAEKADTLDIRLTHGTSNSGRKFLTCTLE